MQNKYILSLLFCFIFSFSVQSFAETPASKGDPFPLIGDDENIDWTIHIKKKRLEIIKLDNLIKKEEKKGKKLDALEESTKSDGFNLNDLTPTRISIDGQKSYNDNPVVSKPQGRLSDSERVNVKIDIYMNKMNIKLKSTQMINGITWAFVDYNGMIMKVRKGDSIDIGYSVTKITENHFEITAKSGTTRIVGFVPTAQSSNVAILDGVSATDLSTSPMFDVNGVPIEPLHLK